MNPTIRFQLSTMMFLEYLIWGSWYVTMGTYLGMTLEFSGMQIGMAYSSVAIAAMISPFFVGMIADRFFRAERVLAFLHLLGGVVMYLASIVSGFEAFYPLMIFYALCFMPTLALTNSISFHKMEDPGKQFSSVRVLGTIGWIVIGIIIGLLDIEHLSIPLKIAAFASVIMGLYSLTLPKTPPQKKEEKVKFRDIIGLDALLLMKSRSFAVFIISSLLICIPLSFYYSFTNLFLNDIGMEKAATKMTMGQGSEIVFLLLLPFFIKRLGYKWTLILGIGAWILRYILFAFGDVGGLAWMLLLGIILHGVCYDFFFVTGQIYVDKKAPPHIRSAAQGFITFVTWGVGIFVGTWLSGKIVNIYTVQEGYSWKNIWLVPTALALAVLIFFILAFRDREAAEVKAG